MILKWRIAKLIEAIVVSFLGVLGKVGVAGRGKDRAWIYARSATVSQNI